jgi:hypothetical protein
MIESEEARAYLAWTRASGAAVAAVTAPRSLSGGVLTIACPSSIWANELTYLGPEILQRMNELSPGHAVKRFRFIVSPLPGASSGEGEENEKMTSVTTVKGLPLTELDGAHVAAAGIRDEHLSRAVRGALAAAAAKS